MRNRRQAHDDDFAAYYNARARRLRTTAYLLCGDWHLAQDLTQLTFTKLYRVWRRVERQGPVDAFAHRVLLRAFLDERRRPWHREIPAPVLADRVLADGEAAAPHTDDGVVLRAALAALPRRQRAVLVLRFWADLSVEQTAAALDCAPGTVKSQTSDALANLRRTLGAALDDLRPNRKA
ncbi:MAG TPA: SigE family RNA polymerase sigma factor [Dactylosporangium sp.]|nr:SigE family RNA polymerase sigma factor [Dactylosporangium sp.]